MVAFGGAEARAFNRRAILASFAVTARAMSRTRVIGRAPAVPTRAETQMLSESQN
jgi:hypothetical protein